MDTELNKNEGHNLPFIIDMDTYQSNSEERLYSEGDRWRSFDGLIISDYKPDPTSSYIETEEYNSKSKYTCWRVR